MAGTNNRQVIEDAFKQFSQQMNEAVYAKLDEICSNLLLDAVVQNRRRNPEAHQFTGNLINSIVVILYDKKEGVQSNYFAYDTLKAPIRKEMSARTARGGERKYAIHFAPDWQGTPHSKYKPKVATDESTGPQDAVAFAGAWTPTTGKDFEICVAYTSEYANWVEEERKTTGFIQSRNYAKKVMAAFGFKRIGQNS